MTMLAPAGTRCPACLGAARPTALRREERYRLLRCRSCRTEFFQPEQPTGTAASEYWEDYKFEVYASDDVRAAYEQRYERLVALAEQSSPVRSVLDVGAGIGNFVEW